MSTVNAAPLQSLTLVPDPTERVQLQDVEVSNRNEDEKPAEETNDGILKSNYADLTRHQVIRKFWKMYLFGILASTCGMFSGYCDSTPGNIIANKGFIKQFGTVHDPKTGALALDANVVSIWGVCQQCLTLVPYVLSPSIADRFGRRAICWVFLFAGVIEIILESVARHWTVWLVAKIFDGFMCGLIQPGPLTLMSEIVMPQMRGNVLSAFALCWCFGGMFSSIGLQILNTVTPTKYLPLVYSEWIFVAIFAVPCVVLPESPPWLIKKGRLDKAKQAYTRIIGNVPGFDLDHEFSVIVQEVEFSKQLLDAQTSSEWKLMFKWTHMRRALIPVLPYAGQSLIGGAYIFSFTTYFFQQAGLSNPFAANMVVTFVGFAGNCLSMLLFDRVGRRPLLIWGTVGAAITNLLIGGLAFLPITPSVGAGLITVTALWVFNYSVTYSTVGWTALVELSTPVLRSKAAGVASAVHGVAKIVWNYTVPQMLSDQKAGWGAKVGLFFGGLTVIWFFLIYLYYPETRLRSYAAIDDLFNRDISPRKFHKTMTEYDTVEFERRMGKGTTVQEWIKGA